MINKPILLDLFCGAGGCTKGYQLAGFYVVGVDYKSQKHYIGDQFVLCDAIYYLWHYGSLYDAIHLSPPCGFYSKMSRSSKTQNNHPNLIPILQDILSDMNKPYILENVEGSKHLLKNPIMLCGTMFDLNVIRHRYFESSFIMSNPSECKHTKKVVKHGRKPTEDNYAGLSGHFSGIDFARNSAGISWMVRNELSQAIPPAYTYWIGTQLIRQI